MAGSSKPFLVAVAGGTGSGKSTLVRDLADRLGEECCGVLEQDRYYRDRKEMAPLEREQQNYDEPEALEIPLLVRHLETLKEGRPVDCPEYDFSSHLRTPVPARFEPKPVLLCEGTLLLAIPEVRNLFDLRIFLEADPGIRLARRLARDVRERGRSKASVLNQYKTTVKPMHQLYIEPSRGFAHLVLRTERNFPQLGQLLCDGLRGLAGI